MVFSSTVHDQFCFQSDIRANVDILETTDKILVNIKSIPVVFSWPRGRHISVGLVKGFWVGQIYEIVYMYELIFEPTLYSQLFHSNDFFPKVIYYMYW